MNLETRNRRQRAFNKFQTRFEECVRRGITQDQRQEKREKYAGLCICPKGRHGGQDGTLAEVFYGNRPIQSFMQTTYDQNNSQPSRKIVAEQGATLAYQLYESGHVMCLIYPCHSENYKQAETCIILDSHIDPTEMMHFCNVDTYLKKHMRALSSYQETTSIDGSPNTREKIFIWWLRFIKRTITENNIQKIKAITVAEKIFFYAATVGLSGFLLLFIEHMFANISG